jgi:hypothetical protein
MKKLFVSAGLVAIGTAGLHAGDVYAPDISAQDASRLWSVSGTLRGFYDDNYTTSHSDSSGKRASWGAEVSPSVGLVMPLQQTELGVRYTYGLYYYQDRSNLGQNPFDQSHQADFWIDHAFSERWEAKVQDTFIDAQDPQLSASATSLPYRATGNNYQNIGTASIHTEWSALFSTDLSYQNQWIHYREHGTTIADLMAPGGTPSYAGLLNQDGHSIMLNLNYEYLPGVTFQVGDSFDLVNYTGDEPIGIDPLGNVFYSKDRDMFSDQIYVGGQYAFTENLNASVNVGASIVDSYATPSFDSGQSTTQVQPYANIALTYTYLPGDYAQVGFTQSSASANISAVNSAGQLTLYQESSVLYASINHQITPYLLLNVIGHYEYSYYVGGAFDGGGQDWYTLEFDLTYKINDYLSAEAGYTFNYYNAGNALPSYTRNVEYIGLTASY